MSPLNSPSSHSSDQEALAALSALGLLSGVERIAFEHHLAVCDLCQVIFTSDCQTIERLLLASTEVEASPRFKQRVLERAAEELGRPPV